MARQRDTTPIRWGNESVWKMLWHKEIMIAAGRLPEPDCPDCGIAWHGLHQPFCDMAECVHGDQLLGCKRCCR